MAELKVGVAVTFITYVALLYDCLPNRSDLNRHIVHMRNKLILQGGIQAFNNTNYFPTSWCPTARFHRKYSRAWVVLVVACITIIFVNYARINEN